jgi:hypothetical protein
MSFDTADEWLEYIELDWTANRREQVTSRQTVESPRD